MAIVVSRVERGHSDMVRGVNRYPASLIEVCVASLVLIVGAGWSMHRGFNREPVAAPRHLGPSAVPQLEDPLAKEHFDEGVRALREGARAQAVSAFTEAVTISPRMLLFV